MEEVVGIAWEAIIKIQELVRGVFAQQIKSSTSSARKNLS
jgi:hypothetical protein